MNHVDNPVGEFRRLWKEQYGCDISEDQALEYEERLVQFVNLVVELEHEQRERAPP